MIGYHDNLHAVRQSELRDLLRRSLRRRTRDYEERGEDAATSRLAIKQCRDALKERATS